MSAFVLLHYMGCGEVSRLQKKDKIVPAFSSAHRNDKDTEFLVRSTGLCTRWVQVPNMYSLEKSRNMIETLHEGSDQGSGGQYFQYGAELKNTGTSNLQKELTLESINLPKEELVLDWHRLPAQEGLNFLGSEVLQITELNLSIFGQWRHLIDCTSLFTPALVTGRCHSSEAMGMDFVGGHQVFFLWRGCQEKFIMIDVDLHHWTT